MQNITTLGQRIEHLITSSGYTVGRFKKKFADTHISEQTIYNSTQPDANPQYDKLALIIERLNHITPKPVSAEWVLFGRGEPYLDKRHGKRKMDDFVLVPVLDLEVSAGPGADGFHEEIKDHIAFKHSFLLRIGVAEEAARVCNVRGESMNRIYPHDSIVLIDTSANVPYPGRDYVILHDGMLRLKRIESVSKDAIIIKSLTHDNDELNERETITSASDFILRGMVKWRAQVV